MTGVLRELVVTPGDDSFGLTILVGQDAVQQGCYIGRPETVGVFIRCNGVRVASTQALVEWLSDHVRVQVEATSFIDDGYAQQVQFQAA